MHISHFLIVRPPLSPVRERSCQTRAFWLITNTQAVMDNIRSHFLKKQTGLSRFLQALVTLNWNPLIKVIRLMKLYYNLQTESARLKQAFQTTLFVSSQRMFVNQIILIQTYLLLYGLLVLVSFVVRIMQKMTSFELFLVVMNFMPIVYILGLLYILLVRFVELGLHSIFKLVCTYHIVCVYCTVCVCVFKK